MWGSNKVITQFAKGVSVGWYYDQVMLKGNLLTDPAGYTFKVVASKTEDNSVVLEQDNDSLGGVTTLEVDGSLRVVCNVDTSLPEFNATDDSYYVEVFGYHINDGWDRLDDFVIKLQPSNHNY